MKLFISQPMKGRTPEYIKGERDQAIDWFKNMHPDKQVEVLNTFFTDMPDGATATEYLARAVGMLAQADEAMFIGDYENYKGCLCEHFVALVHMGIPIHYWRTPNHNKFVTGFPTAIALIHDHKKCMARHGWSNRNCFVFWTPDSTVEERGKLRSPVLVHEYDQCPHPRRVYIRGHYDVLGFSEEGVPVLATGWVPSQEDMQANDWYIVKGFGDDDTLIPYSGTELDAQ